MAKNENPFAIRKSPVSIITAQAVNLDDYAVNLDDYVQKTIYDGDRVSVCATVD